MSFSLRNFVATNAVLAAGVGVPVNVILLWLIQNKTIKEMSAYSLILLQACICDLIVVVIHALAQPLVLVDGTANTIVLAGPAQALTVPWSCLVADIWTFFALISLYQQYGAQFYYRYVLTTQNRKISLCRYLLALATIPALFVAVMGSMQWVGVHSGVSYQGFSNAKLGELFGFVSSSNTSNNNQTTNFAFRSEIHFLGRVNLVLYLLCFGSSYMAVLICGVKTRQYVRQYLIGPSEAVAREVNRQMQWTLCIQSVIPLLSLIPTIVVLVFFQTNFLVSKDAKTMAVIWVVIYAPRYWIPVVGPFVAIYVVKAYRETIAEWWISLMIRCCRNKKETTAAAKI